MTAADPSADDAPPLRRNASPSAQEGAHIILIIADRGSGMDAQLLARIGEPFFTTKAPGRGMGLGMFLARAVIEGVGGTLSLQSELGKGTTARVTLPLSPGAPPQTRPKPPASEPESPPASPSAPP